MASEFEKWEQGKLLTESVFNVKQGELVCSCMSPEQATEIVRDHNATEEFVERLIQLLETVGLNPCDAIHYANEFALSAGKNGAK